MHRLSPFWHSRTLTKFPCLCCVLCLSCELHECKHASGYAHCSLIISLKPLNISIDKNVAGSVYKFLDLFIDCSVIFLDSPDKRLSPHSLEISILGFSCLLLLSSEWMHKTAIQKQQPKSITLSYRQSFYCDISLALRSPKSFWLIHFNCHFNYNIFMKKVEKESQLIDKNEVDFQEAFCAASAAATHNQMVKIESIFTSFFAAIACPICHLWMRL